MQPAIALDEFDMEEQLLAYSLHASGLGDDDLTQDETPGDSWNEGMSRRNSGWDDEDEW
jgi:hypothetical protein